MTSLETQLISDVRLRVGDNPFLIGTEEIDTTKVVWTDAEILRLLTTQMIIEFAGKKSDVNILNVFEQMIVVISASVALLRVLAVNSAKYSKFSGNLVTIEKVSPSEFIKMANALELTLKDMKESSLEYSTRKVVVSESSIYDKRSGKYIPESSDGGVPSFSFSITPDEENSCLLININFPMITDYSYHLVKKSVNDSEPTVVAHYYEIAKDTYRDTNVTFGGNNKYTYIIEIFDNNDHSNSYEESVVI